jgi:hypothetical protein
MIHVDDTFHSRNSTVSTESTESGGGNIDLSAGHIVELVDSQVTTSVQGGTGGAGNITIGPRYVILNDSQVITQADKGKGGNIDIGADVFIASPTSVVSASSQTGISGTIDIRGVVNNLSGSIAPLPQRYLSTAALSEDRCAGRLREGQISSFVVAGRAGMPLQPGGVLPSPWYDVGQVRVQGGPVRSEDHVAPFDFPFDPSTAQSMLLRNKIFDRCHIPWIPASAGMTNTTRPSFRASNARPGIREEKPGFPPTRE